jgi:hypothetical protein
VGVSSPSLDQAGRAPPSSMHHHALPLLYCPPPPLSVTDAHRHQWRHLHFTVARSPPSPLAPIKGTLVVPHLATPHTTLISSSLASELAPTARCQSPPFATVTRSLHHCSVSSEGTPNTARSPFPTSDPRNDR